MIGGFNLITTFEGIWFNLVFDFTGILIIMSFVVAFLYEYRVRRRRQNGWDGIKRHFIRLGIPESDLKNLYSVYISTMSVHWFFGKIVPEFGDE